MPERRHAGILMRGLTYATMRRGFLIRGRRAVAACGEAFVGTAVAKPRGASRLQRARRSRLTGGR